jgi:uncharacterized cupin superfamily protein
MAPNAFEPEWDVERDQGSWRRAKLGAQAGARELGASLFELGPGAHSFPLHVHFVNEELILVLEGHPTLTTADDRRSLAPGDVVACPAGRAGAHRLDNETSERVRVVVVSTMRTPEINEMLEDGSYWLHDWSDGRDPQTAGLDQRLDPRADP